MDDKAQIKFFNQSLSTPAPASGFQGAEKLAKTREVRDAIKEKIEQWCAEVCCLAAA